MKYHKWRAKQCEQGKEKREHFWKSRRNLSLCAHVLDMYLDMYLSMDWRFHSLSFHFYDQSSVHSFEDLGNTFFRILTNRENLLAPQYWTSWTLELPGFDRHSQGRTRRNCAFPYPLGGLPVERGQHMSQSGHGQIFESQECQRGIELPANILFWLFSLFLLYFTEMEYEAKRFKTEGFLFLV